MASDIIHILSMRSAEVHIHVNKTVYYAHNIFFGVTKYSGVNRILELELTIIRCLVDTIYVANLC